MDSKLYTEPFIFVYLKEKTNIKLNNMLRNVLVFILDLKNLFRKRLQSQFLKALILSLQIFSLEDPFKLMILTDFLGKH